MSGGVAFYPWLVSSRTVSEILLGGLAAVVLLYLWLRAGRDRLNDRPVGDQPPVTDYAGIVQSGHNKIPAVLVAFIVFLTLWTFWYIIHVAVVGGLNY